MIPAQLTSFIGRTNEAEQVRELLRSSRLVTLTGPGGMGKTRLAAYLASITATDFENVWWVELAPVSDPSLIVSSIAAAIGSRNHVSVDETQALIATLHRRGGGLLVIDNCEHLVGASATIVDRLLRECPSLTILATSREVLEVQGEAAWRLNALAYPPPGAALDLAAIADYPAVQLFVERAAQSLPGFTLQAADVTSVAEICARLGGMPLALELAAAGLYSFSPRQIAERLDDSLLLLAGGNRTASIRQQSLRDTLDWSYQLLLEAERRLFARLAVFAGGWSLQAAEAVCASDALPRTEVMALLGQLVRKSLVTRENRDGEVRYSFLEAVRTYALRCLSSEELEALGSRHFRWVVDLVETPSSFWHGPDQAAWLRRCEHDYANLRTALQWAIEAGQQDAAARLLLCLWPYWDNRGMLSEWQSWVQRVLAASPKTTSAVVYAKSALAYITLAQGDPDTALALDRETLQEWEQLGDRVGMAWAKKRIGIVSLARGDPEAARERLTAAVAEARGAPPSPEQATTTYLTLLVLADLSRIQGRASDAETLYEESAQLMREHGDRAHLAHALLGMALVRQAQGRLVNQEPLLQESLHILHTLGDHRFITACLDGLACLAAERGLAQRAAVLFGAATALRESVGAAPAHALFATARERGLDRTRSRLSSPRFEVAWNEGVSLGYEDAVALALSAGVEPSSFPSANRWPDLLTAREREVADLLADRLTNREIAQRLVITEQTAETHVKRVLSKLRVTSRTQVAEWSQEQTARNS